MLSASSGQPEGDAQVSLPHEGGAQSGGSVEPQALLPVPEPGTAKLPCDFLPQRANGGSRAAGVPEAEGRKPHDEEQPAEPGHQH